MARSLVACDAGGTMTDVIVVDEGSSRGRPFASEKEFADKTLDRIRDWSK